MLTVRHGPFEALEAEFVARLKEFCKEVPTRAAVVAPSRRLADRLERLAAVEHGLPLLGVEFHTFHSLAVAIVEESGFPKKRLVSDAVFHDRLVDRLLEDMPGVARFFGGQARPKALASALRASLRDLIDAGVSGTSLEEHFGEDLLREPRERERLGALLTLASAYERRLEELGLLSSAGLARLAASRAEGSGLLRGYREILYYGFYDLTGVQLEFFEAVSARHAARLFFPYRQNHPAFRFADAFFDEKLRGHDAAPAQGGRAPALAPALEHLFGTGAAALPKGRLSVVSASGARDEAWAAAKEVLRLTETRGLAFEDIGVAARTLEPYRAALAEVFEENAIPCDLGAGRPLLGEPAAKTALNLLSLRRRDFPAAVVEDLFGSPYFKPSVDARRARHWKLAIRALGIRAGWLQWRGKLEARTGDDFELAPGREGPRVPRADMRALWDLVSGLEAELSVECETWAKMSARALETLERRWGLPEEPRAEETAACELVRQALESLAAFDLLGGRPGWEEFLDAFESKLRRASLPAGSGARGVRALDAMDARGQGFKALIVLGLKEKLFPRLVVEDPLLREPARAALRHPAGYWISRKSTGYEEERLLFYLAMASASERVVCVYPRSDEAGKAEVPSLYLRELCRASGISLNTTDLVRIARQPRERLERCEAPLLTPKELSLKRAFDGVLPDEDARVVAALNRFGAPGERDGLVGPPEEHLKRLRRDGLSPSALDELAQCPFQYFAGRVLGLGSFDSAAEKGEFAAWVRGKIYHAALERFYARKGAEPIEACVEAVFGEYDWKKMGVYPVLWQAAKRAMSSHLREFAVWDQSEQKASGLSPLWLEKELSGEWPGPLPEGLSGLRARGVVDRVDADPGKTRFRVVDYKTRWRWAGRLSKHIIEGRLHQLPLYSELAGDALGSKAQLAQAAIYSIEDDPEDRAKSYEGSEWAADRKAFFELTAQRLAGLASGRFTIKPNDDDFGYCRFCEFAALCRKNHGPSRRRAAGPV